MATFSFDVNSAMINMVWIPCLVSIRFPRMQRVSKWYGCRIWSIHFLECETGMIM
jgi:hypothetical protein